MRCRSCCESLEKRYHLAITASLSFLPIGHVGVLSVVGTSANDAINVHHSGARFSVDGVTLTFAASDVQVLRVNAGAGNDNIQLFMQFGDTTMIEVHGDAGDDSIHGSIIADKLYGDAGNDVVWGDLGNDLLDGGAGDDQLAGGAGNDSIYGNIGKDSLYGGVNVSSASDGDDFLHADFSDTKVHGEKGADQIIYDNLDISTLPTISGNVSALQNFVNNNGLLKNLPLSWVKDQVKYRINNLQLLSATISNGISRLSIRGDLHTESVASINGTPVASASGTIRFSLQPLLNMNLVEADHVQTAAVTLGNTGVDAITIHNIPNAVDNPGQFRVWINDSLSHTSPSSIVSVAQPIVQNTSWPDHHT